MHAVATMNLTETCMLDDKPLASSSPVQTMSVQTMSFLCVEWRKQTSNISDNKNDILCIHTNWIFLSDMRSGISRICCTTYLE